MNDKHLSKEPTAELRYIIRDNKKVLQQKIKLWFTDYLQGHEWTDVPVKNETPELCRKCKADCCNDINEYGDIRCAAYRP